MYKYPTINIRNGSGKTSKHNLFNSLNLYVLRKIKTYALIRCVIFMQLYTKIKIRRHSIFWQSGIDVLADDVYGYLRFAVDVMSANVYWVPFPPKWRRNIRSTSFWQGVFPGCRNTVL